jgi:hypothetical protein
MKQAQTSSPTSKVRSDILSIPIASLIPFAFLNPNWSSPSTSSIFFSVLASTFAACVMRLIVRWLLHFLALFYSYILDHGTNWPGCFIFESSIEMAGAISWIVSHLSFHTKSCP